MEKNMKASWVDDKKKISPENDIFSALNWIKKQIKDILAKNGFLKS